MKLRPLHDWALIRRIASAEKTSGGIIIPEAAKEKKAEGVIEAIGPGRYKKEPGRKGRYIPTVLKPGQRVLFTDYMAKDVELDGEEFTFIREEDVLGLVEDTGALEVKKTHPVMEKKDQPVMVQARPAAAPAEKKKPEVNKTPAKKAKKETKKAAVAKKTVAAKKATPAKKTVKKAVSKTAAKKKTKSPVKKTAAKKPASKKTAPAKKSLKKIAVKKAVAKKPLKKTVAKTKKKTGK